LYICTNKFFNCLKTKKIYIKPEVKEIIIDNNISMVMMTGESDPPGGPWDNDRNNNFEKDDSKNNRESPFKR